MGVYKPTATILEVKNAQGQIVDQWKDSSEQVIDSQIAYELADIMSDQKARLPAFGTSGSYGFLPGSDVKIAGKTGTSNDGVTGAPKDFWFMSYSPNVAFGVWAGNHEPTSMRGYSTVLGTFNRNVMYNYHKNVLAADGTWKSNDWFTQPAGIQKLTVSGKTDLFPSWFNKTTATAGEKMKFDSISKMKATDCTPDAAKIEIEVQTITDPLTKEKTYSTTADGYYPNATDTIHNCSDTKPFVNSIDVTGSGSTYSINISVTQGTHQLQSINVSVDGTSIGTASVSSSGTYSISYSGTGSHTISAYATDIALYTSSTVSVKKNLSGNGN
jgi:penicillin-binding protein 1A